MRTIGLIGGSTWHSTIDYYKYINSLVNEKLGGHHSAKIYMYSFNFNFIKCHADKEEWDVISKRMIYESKKLVEAGADCLVLCANTLHYIADELNENISIPIIHIADAVGKELNAMNIKRAGLLGSKFTMERDFYHDKLKKYDIEGMIPDDGDREIIYNIIFNELAHNIINPKSEEKLELIIEKLKARGAEAIILGCTEIPMLIKESKSNLPLLNTTLIHANAAVDYALPPEH